MVRRLQLGGHVGRAPRVGRAGPCSLLATRHAGPAVTAMEGLGRWGLAGEQSSMAQASRTGGPEPLFILVVLLVLVLIPVLVPQVFLQLLLLLLFPFRLPGGGRGQRSAEGRQLAPTGQGRLLVQPGFPCQLADDRTCLPCPQRTLMTGADPSAHTAAPAHANQLPSPPLLGRECQAVPPSGPLLGLLPPPGMPFQAPPGPWGPSLLQGALCPPR